MKTKIFGSLLLLTALLSACGDPNHYDSHKGQEPDTAESYGHDTIQGRAPDSTNVVIDSTNRGIGDTTLGRTH